MIRRQFDLKTDDGVCDAFVSYPEEHGRYPAVLFYMDGYGPRPYLYEMAEKLATRGYYVFLPNLLYQARRAPVIDAEFPITNETLARAREQLMAVFGKHDPDDNLRDTDHFMKFLDQQKQVKSGPMGATGYCMGGGLALRTAARFPARIAAAASFHGGRLATDAPNSPHLELGKIKAELYIAHADKDQSMPPEQIERLRQALDASGLRYKAELYEGAAHGFTMADLPAYNKISLERHWTSLFDLFQRRLT